MKDVKQDYTFFLFAVSKKPFHDKTKKLQLLKLIRKKSLFAAAFGAVKENILSQRFVICRESFSAERVTNEGFCSTIFRRNILAVCSKGFYALMEVKLQKLAGFRGPWSLKKPVRCSVVTLAIAYYVRIAGFLKLGSFALRLDHFCP